MQIRSKEITLVKCSELKPNPKNRNIHPKDQIDRLAEIIKYQGFRNPITVSNQSGFIVAGHGRLEAAKQLGIEAVPVIYQDFESEEQEYAAQVSDNAIASWAELDLSGINADLPELGPDFDIDLLGLKNFELDVADKEGLTDEDEVPEARVEPKTKLGDIYRLGNHRLMCGDSTSVTDVENLMNGEKAQTFFTDPPYGDNVGGLSPKTGKEKAEAIRLGKTLVNRKTFIANDDRIEWLEEVFNLVTAFMEEQSTKMVFFKWDKFEQIKSMAKSFGEPSALCVWNRVKKASAFFRFQPQHEMVFHWGNQADKKEKIGLSNVWSEPKEMENNELHPTVKPIAILEPAIRVTTEVGKIVLDLFGGSGSTLIACEKTNRKAYLMELDPKYCDVIVERWENFTGQKAELLNAQE